MPELKLNKWDYIKTDESDRHNISFVYAGDDIVTRSTTVTLIMGSGRKAAKVIHEDLMGKKVELPLTCAVE